MAKAKWTLPARDDLKQIGVYIGRTEHRPAAASKMMREIKAKCDEYSQAFGENSVMGSKAQELGEDCRAFSYKRWVIVFEPINNGIEVLRIFDGSRDYPQLFGTDG